MLVFVPKCFFFSFLVPFICAVLTLFFFFQRLISLYLPYLFMESNILHKKMLCKKKISNYRIISV